MKKAGVNKPSQQRNTKYNINQNKPRMTELCRACMLSSQGMINIFAGAPESGIPIVDIIAHYTGLDVKRGDSFPETICPVCLQDARDSYSFIASFEDGHQFLAQVKQEKGGFEQASLEEEAKQILHCQVKREFLEEPLPEEVVCDISDSHSEQSHSTQGIGYPVEKEKPTGGRAILDSDEDFSAEGALPFKCPLCQKSFRREWSLQVHERSHVGLWPFKCTQCSKPCRTARDLSLHNRIHTGERPYKCDYCEKAFRERQGLKFHVRVHTGERPHKCSYCEKTYKERKSLRVHTRSHTGERPYKCAHCQSTFADPSSFRGHVRIHARNPM
ncbi:zinc finger and SCAN domain-containing protein 5B [Drosophila biarmipes]|uniref:zinc finger and SCAN domain-containing protein 5B n=1 Tax=Drosophila biarmipes TaxID=125945 RepID=UPI0007E5E04A|nr:zinc finger and SCAN domain-containing protein 5B [Drosophila biarmipes]